MAFDITVYDGRKQYSVGENLGYNGNRHEWGVKKNSEIRANNFLKRFAMNGFGELREKLEVIAGFKILAIIDFRIK